MKKSFITIIVPLAFFLFISPAFSDKEQSELRKRAFLYYSAGDFEQAFPHLLKLVESDSCARFWMDYFMLADILVRRAEPDSAGWAISLGEKRTRSNADTRIVKRNKEIWDDLDRQLKSQRNYLTVPLYRKLDEFAEKPADSTSADSTKKAIKESSLQAKALASDTLKTPVSSPPELGATTDTLKLSPPMSPIPFSSEVQPKLIGGNDAVKAYIEAHHLFPDSARSTGVKQGVVMVNVTVDTFGTPVDFSLFRIYPEGMGFEALAVEVLRNMQYEPAITDSGKVIGVLQQPVLFQSP